MVVNSFVFLVFFLIVFGVYYLPICRKKNLIQNTWLFLTSYFFYGYTNWRIVVLLLGATLVFYFLGLWLYKEIKNNNEKHASFINTFGICLGIGILLYFKYLDFFIQSFAVVLRSLGFHITWATLNLIVPIGVSFFTFKLISYIIEIYNENITPSKSFIEFATYIAFFPTILSGPIDRPNAFLPQLRKVHNFDYNLAVDGCRQILWGMFLKMCICDNLAAATDRMWNTYSSQSGASLFLISLLYPIQLYGDFAGYSDMAIGVGKILGFRVTRNFNHPFLARNIAEFWRRWHMSLTNWITDYVFTPLSFIFRRAGKRGIIFAIIINLIIIGFWHEANLKYGVFGIYHGLLFIPLILSGAFQKKTIISSNKIGFPYISDLTKMIFTYFLLVIGFIITVAPNISSAIGFIDKILTSSIFEIPRIGVEIKVYFFILFLLMIEWFKREEEHPLQNIKKRGVRWLYYMMLSYLIVYHQGVAAKFIYFQF